MVPAALSQRWFVETQQPGETSGPALDKAEPAGPPEGAPPPPPALGLLALLFCVKVVLLFPQTSSPRHCSLAWCIPDTPVFKRLNMYTYVFSDVNEAEEKSELSGTITPWAE